MTITTLAGTVQARFPEGSVVEIDGRKGTVDFVDDFGKIFVEFCDGTFGAFTVEEVRKEKENESF